jgi:hypothetical protein
LAAPAEEPTNATYDYQHEEWQASNKVKNTNGHLEEKERYEDLSSIVLGSH